MVIDLLYIINITTIFLSLFSSASVMFNFPDQATVKRVVYSLPRVGVGTSYGLPQARWAQLIHRWSLKRIILRKQRISKRVCLCVCLYQTDILGHTSTAVQVVQHDSALAEERDLQLWVPHVPQHYCRWSVISYKTLILLWLFSQPLNNRVVLTVMSVLLCSESKLLNNFNKFFYNILILYDLFVLEILLIWPNMS